jgi:hypothetical protein
LETITPHHTNAIAAGLCGLVLFMVIAEVLALIRALLWCHPIYEILYYAPQ